MTARRAVVLAEPPSEWALRELPARVAVFLRAAGTHAPLRVALKAGGYGPADHAEGLRLLADACPYRDDGFDPTADLVARRAAVELEAWTRRHLMRLRTAVERLHPDALALFPARVPEGPEVTLTVGVLLERLKKLESMRPGARVLTTLGARGLDASLRRQLATLVDAAKYAAPPPAPSHEVFREPGAPDAELVALHRWFDDWSGTARALIGRKDWLIRLGLADRRRTTAMPPRSQS